MYQDIFIKNKYYKWYFAIIERGKDRELPAVYLEEHHVMPRSIQPNSETVMLTAKEHFVCHLLLTKMCRHTGHRCKMLNAFQMIANAHAPNQQRYTSASYAAIKKQIAEAKRDMYSGAGNPFYGRKHTKQTLEKIATNRPSFAGVNNPNYGKKHSQMTRDQMSQNRKGKGIRTGKEHHQYGKHLSNTHKQNLSLALTGQQRSELTKEKISKSKQGCQNPNHGKVIPQSTKDKLSAALTGKSRSGTVKQKMAAQKAKAVCRRMYEHYNVITENAITEAKLLKLIAPSSSSYQKIIEVLGSIPVREEHSTTRIN